MGVLAFGAINAYMLRRQHHQAAAERAEHTGEQGAEIVEQSEVLQSTNTTESSGAIDQAIQGKGDDFEATDETPTRDAATEARSPPHPLCDWPLIGGSLIGAPFSFQNELANSTNLHIDLHNLSPPNSSRNPEDLMKRSASHEPGGSPSSTLHNDQGTSNEYRKSSPLSSGFRKFFRNRSVSKTRDPSSSTYLIPKSAKMDQCNRSRLSKSFSTFFIKCCQCCGCCNAWGNTTDSPPYADEFRHHRKPRRYLCCCRGPWTKVDRVSASEPQLSPPPPTVLPSIRVRFENQVLEMEGKDHISRRREVGRKSGDEVDAEVMNANRGDPMMIERKLNDGNVQKGEGEDELSESSETVTTEPNLVSRNTC
ncbi:unnamed protein product [Taenia asiatica]|uniref:Uncharacterized protein n=1 Tax=Taenia asiatica TaxID=60517 RepID=A0A0R3VUU1_TAEAS|nr:unnamed protein product [Taenia asiatica]